MATPRFLTELPPGTATYGPATARVAASVLRRPYMPWQTDAANLIGAVDGAGRMKYRYVVVHVPRRAGKTITVLASLLHRAARRPSTLCWYSAQTREAAAISFRNEWTPLLTASPIFGSGLTLRKSNGSEAVQLIRAGRHTGSVGLYAPSATALHGSDADAVCQDEAWAFTLDQGADIESGLQPAQLTRPERQLLIVSAGGTDASTWLQHWLTLARDGTPRVALVDYGADIDADTDDPAVWAAVHPAIGHTIDLEGIAGMKDTMPAAEFRRAVLNVQTPAKVKIVTAIAAELWQSCAHPEATLTGAPAFGVDVDDQGVAYWCAATRVADTVTVEIVGTSTGTPAGVAMWRDLRARHRGRLDIDRLGPADALADALIAAGLGPHVVTTAEYSAGCADIVQRLKLGTLAHRDQPLLTTAALGAAARPIGDRWVWHRKASNVAPVAAMSLAAYATRRARRGGPLGSVQEG